MKESEIVEILKKESEEFKKLETEHRNLKMTLAEINKKRFHSTDEEMERKKMQKKKLQMKDRMAEMIRKYKKANN